ncbi:MAG: NYN domain-containing protein [Acidobacteria bacterium]|nr:NYN domain-containing protein [Acidobacteriota bacterium]
MSYLVDGNNVMAQRVGWHKDKPRARRRLLDEVAAFAAAKRARVTVVFDGAPEQHFADGASYRGVRVFYAERGSNADERIKKLVEASRERRTLVVVTSDRDLAAYVRNCGAQVIRSGDFRKRMQAETLDTTSASSESANAIPQQELPDWMRYFGVDPEDEEEE